MSKDISRREVLKLGAVAVGLVAVSPLALKVAASTAPKTATEEFLVAVANRATQLTAECSCGANVFVHSFATEESGVWPSYKAWLKEHSEHDKFEAVFEHTLTTSSCEWGQDQ